MNVRRLLTVVSLLLLITFVLLVVNQTAQLVLLAGTFHRHAGTVTMWSLLAVYLALGGMVAYMLLRLPKPLVPPPDDTGPAFEEHLRAMRQRLAGNPHLAAHPLESREDIEGGLMELGRQADRVCRETASTVFLSTAISQNGRLDTVMVLVAQCRMIWNIAHLYVQRPPAREMIHLYTNVLGTAFAVGHLEDLDVSEQVEPVVAATLAGMSGIVPGFQVMTTLIVNSMLSGTANALLTLRVGMIAKRYCGSLLKEDRRLIRRSATAEAVAMVGSVAAEGGRELSRSYYAHWKDRASKNLGRQLSRVREAGSAVGETLASGGQAVRDGMARGAERSSEVMNEIREQVQSTSARLTGRETRPDPPAGE